MQITSGTRIGSYEIVDSLGAGGMGNVYRASDPRLGREIAIKALPVDVARNPEAMARFEREARFLAALSHPNIAAIYEIEEHQGERFLILELVRGETLDAVLTRGPIGITEVVRMAIEIASGLEAAHEAGIVHRDLKPSNVKITPEGRVKILDFGLAKHLPTTGDLSRAATMDHDLTRDGSVVGTPAYMSPEQLRGGEIDRRTDIWAFGCLLYEMLTGHRPFNGSTFLELADAIRSTEPDWTALPHGTPERLAHVLQRCLRKDPRERLHDIGDARLDLEELSSHRRDHVRRRLSQPVLPIVIAAVVLGTLAVVLWRNWPTPAGNIGGAPKLTQITFAEGTEEFPAWSPDGASVVYVGEVGGIRKLFIKRIGTNEDKQITAGSYDELQPAFSTDGRILFVRGREPNRRVEPGDVFGMYESTAADLWTIDLATGRETRLLAGAFSPAVSPDGKSIAVDASLAGPRRIWIVDAHGYNPQQVTTDSSEAVLHIAPRWSPDGKKIAYQRVERTKFDIAVVDVGSRRSTSVTDDSYQDINPVWSAANFIYFASNRAGGINVWRIRLKPDGSPASPPQQVTSGAGQDVDLAVTRDGKRLTYATLRQNADLWRLPLKIDGMAAGQPQPVVATTREDSRGAWSPDGQTIAFNSDRNGDMNIWLYSLGDHTTRQLTHGAGGDFQPSWSPDGRQIAFFSSRTGDANIWKVDVPSGKLTPLTRGSSLDINPFFSPDGSEIVYQSDASGRLEVWVMRSDGSQPRQRSDVSVSGHFERWLPDDFIYFRSPEKMALMRVAPVSGEAEMVVPLAPGTGGAHISFSPDASRFIDVIGHKVLWIFTLKGGSQKLFAFDDPEVRIDYPVWSPDGQWLLFDRYKPEGGDLWMAEGLE